MAMPRLQSPAFLNAHAAAKRTPDGEGNASLLGSSPGTPPAPTHAPADPATAPSAFEQMLNARRPHAPASGSNSDAVATTTGISDNQKQAAIVSPRIALAPAPDSVSPVTTLSDATRAWTSDAPEKSDAENAIEQANSPGDPVVQPTFEFASLGMFGLDAAGGLRTAVQYESVDAALPSMGGEPNNPQAEQSEADVATVVGPSVAAPRGVEGDARPSATTLEGMPSEASFSPAKKEIVGLVAAASSVALPASGKDGLDFDADDASVASQEFVVSTVPAEHTLLAPVGVDSGVVVNKLADETSESGDARGGLPQPSKEPEENRLAVFVFGSDDATAVTVRVADAAGDPNTLRNAIERTTAEYGVRLDELYVNGSASPPVFSSKGNSRGRYSR